ncbi:MAG: N-6 DNA methylase [Opitutaceae bacterium]|nr:N-6 DNA methylase [Opitutaceae bacterium]
MLTAETKRRIDSCRDILVGKLPLPTDQVELITLALIYKFMDDLDEESVAMGGKRSFFTGALAPYRWRALMPQTVSAEERMARFADGLELLGGGKKLRVPKKNGKKGEEEEIDPAAHLPALFRDIFRNAFLKFRDGRILTLFLTELGGFAYSHSEELGNAFEYILQCMGAQGDNGQFRTPRHIIDFMVACLDPQPTDKILDPACGTGGFLVSAFKHILEAHTSPGSTLPGDRLSHEQRQRLYANFTGYDTNDQMVKLSRVNLFLHQFASPTIHIYDTLTNDARWHEKADLILANPPFMTPKGGVVPHTRFRIPAKKSEVLFTDYIAEHLTPDGRAGVIVPNGIVATTQNAYVKLRRFLVEDSLVAVVSLPTGVFKPYSGVKTSILFLDKKLARRTDKILFLKIAADGFDLGDQRRPIEDNDLPLAKRYLDRWFNGQFSVMPPELIPFKLVEKRELVAHRSVGLQVEQLLGEVAENNSEHKIVRLGDVCETTSGGTPLRSKTEFYEGGTIPWIKSGEVAQGRVTTAAESITELGLKSSSAKLFPIDTVLVAMYGATAGEVGILKIPATTNQAVCGVLPNERFVPEFLFYALRSLKEEMKCRAGGGAQPNISQQIIRDLEIPLLPLEEQRRIVAEIEGYQQVIDGARQILAAYRPRIDIDSEWPMVELSSVIREKPKNGYSGQPVQHPTKLKVLSLSATTSGRLDATKFKYLDEEIPQNAQCRCRHGDIYLQRGNTAELVGTAALFDIDDADFIYPDLMIRVRADESKVLTKFLLHTLQSEPVRAFLKRQAGGAAGSMPKVNQGIVERVPIPLPPLPEQERIVAKLDAEAARIEAVRGLIPAFEAKIQRVLARVWGTRPQSCCPP